MRFTIKIENPVVDMFSQAHKTNSKYEWIDWIQIKYLINIHKNIIIKVHNVTIM